MEDMLRNFTGTVIEDIFEQEEAERGALRYVFEGGYGAMDIKREAEAFRNDKFYARYIGENPHQYSDEAVLLASIFRMDINKAIEIVDFKNSVYSQDSLQGACEIIDNSKYSQGLKNKFYSCVCLDEYVKTLQERVDEHCSIKRERAFFVFRYYARKNCKISCVVSAEDEGSVYVSCFGVKNVKDKRKGYGTKLMTSIIKAFNDKDITLKVESDNIPALQFYAKMGFHKVEEKSSRGIYFMLKKAEKTA